MRFLSVVARAGLTFVLTLVLVDVVVRAFFPALPRLGGNFSAFYLERALARIGPSDIVVLGDSVLWGYRLPPSQSAAALLQQRGTSIVNLSFEGGSVANTFALLRLMEALGAHPRAVLFNVNVKEFNPADSAYRTLYPAVERAVWADLTPSQRARLHQTQTATNLDAKVDAKLSQVWALYGMRADERELLFGAADAATAVDDEVKALSGEAAREAAAHVPTPDRLLGTYDLSPLTRDNVEVAFLHDTVAELQRMHVPAVAVLTPTNHTLLHDYIDVPEYDAQLRYVTAILKAGGVRVLDADRAIPAAEFLDNDHLTAAGNERFAHLLASALAR